MTRFLLTCFLAGTIMQPAFAALKEGDTAPDFKAPASLAGKTFNFSLKDALKKGPVVVYFYPSAYTEGCDIEAHAFAENHGKFIAAGATVIGVSLDSIDRLNDFSADPKYCAGKIPVASDAGGKIAQSYDLSVKAIPAGKRDVRGAVIDHGLAERRTFIVAPDGKIAAAVGDVAPDRNVSRTLEIVQRIGMRNASVKKQER